MMHDIVNVELIEQRVTVLNYVSVLIQCAEDC